MKKLVFFLSVIFCRILSYAQSDGTLDPAFGSGGKVTIDIASGSDDLASDLAVMSDGSILISGNFYVNAPDIVVCSFTSSGTLNTSFGTGGMFLMDVENDSYDFLNAIALDSSERIVGVGNSLIGADKYFTVIRLHPNGSLDSTFGINGLVKLNPSIECVGNDVAIQPDGKILVAGYIDEGITTVKACIIRLNDDGSYDGSFGDNGVWEGSADPAYDQRAYTMTLQPDGKILIGGYLDLNGDGEFTVARVLASGSMDVSFDTDGWAVKNLSVGNDDIGKSIIVQDDGKILLAGVSNSQIAVCRFNDDGSDDIGFGSSGNYTNALQSGGDVLNSVIIQPDNKILLAGGGSNNNEYDFLLLRLTSGGVPDSTFGANGITYTDFGTGDDLIGNIMLQQDGDIVAAGSATIPYNLDFALTRYSNSFLDIKDPGDDAGISIHPNPSDGNCTIKLNGVDEINITCFVNDLTGREILRHKLVAGAKILQLDMSNLPGGVYFIEAIEESQHALIAREKIVIR